MTWTMRVPLAALIFALLVNRHAQAVGPALVNPGFDAQDASGGDVSPAPGWVGFNYAFVTQSVPAHSAPNTLKAYGPYYAPGASGAFQDSFPANPGEVWGARAWARIDSSDPMNPTNLAQVVLSFRNGSNTEIGFTTSTPITTSTLPINTWQQFSAVGVAPPGTAAVRMQLLHVQLSPSASNGSIFFDDASLGIIPEPATALLMVVACWGCCAFVRRPKR
jgi:hypothetical protein